MTDTQQVAQAADPLQELYASIAQSAALLKQRMDRAKKDPNKPLTVGALAAVLDGDVFPFLTQTVEKIGQLRDGTVAGFNELEERLADVQAGDSGLSAEDVAALRQVVLDLRELVTVVRSAGVGGAVAEKLTEFEGHATAAEAVLDQIAVEEEDDEEASDGDDEGAEG